MKRTGERGSAMVVTLIIIAALLSGAAVLFSMQMQSNRATDLTRSKMAALHCAEAGLVTARALVAANYPRWNASLGQATEPSWLSTLAHDLDNDQVGDFTITLRDNADELTSDDPTHDNDLSVFVVSTCTKYADTPVQVSELVRYNGAGNCYQAQFGGCGGNANAN